MVPSPPAPIQRRGNRLNQFAVAQAAMVISETVLPEGWDAPLQNPLPRLVPFLPAPALRRVRPDAHREIMADHQIQQQHALAALQEQQRLRHIAMVEEQERQQQALAILHQERLREEERLRQQEQEHIDLDPEHRPLNAAMAQRIFQGWEQQHEADLEEDFNDLGHQNDIPSEDDLKYVDPAEYQPAEQLDPPLDDSLGPQDDMSSDDGLEYVDPAQQRSAEDLDPVLPNDPPQLENLAENIPAEEPEPPFELPISPQLGPVQPILRGRPPYLMAPHYLGPITVICPHLSTKNNPKFSMCCLQGQVNLPRLQDAPADLLKLLHGHHALSNTFKTSIHQYNAAFAFTSLGVKIDHAITNAPGPYSFRNNGELHHLTGALLPIEGNLPVYARLYFYDHNQQLAFCQQNNPRLDSQIMASLQDMLARVNPFIGLYKQARQIMGEVPEGQPQRLFVKLTADFGDPQHYNDPNKQEELAAVIPGDGSEE
ncbi:hypothetical protein E4T56_gene5328 [Termitomyces sp. T112]|nr:hypothetical protein E4T56_gene5328 [Termitomyces sp. T112]